MQSNGLGGIAEIGRNRNSCVRDWAFRRYRYAMAPQHPTDDDEAAHTTQPHKLTSLRGTLDHT
jgi:hypothetical protein